MASPKNNEPLQKRGRKGALSWLRRLPARTCSPASLRPCTTTPRLSRCARSTSPSSPSLASTRPSRRLWSFAQRSPLTSVKLRVRWPTRSSLVCLSAALRRWLRVSVTSSSRVLSPASRARRRMTRRPSSSPSR